MGPIHARVSKALRELRHTSEPVALSRGSRIKEPRASETCRPAARLVWRVSVGRA